MLVPPLVGASGFAVDISTKRAGVFQLQDDPRLHSHLFLHVMPRASSPAVLFRGAGLQKTPKTLARWHHASQATCFHWRAHRSNNFGSRLLVQLAFWAPGMSSTKVEVWRKNEIIWSGAKRSASSARCPESRVRQAATALPGSSLSSAVTEMWAHLLLGSSPDRSIAYSFQVRQLGSQDHCIVCHSQMQPC